MVKERNTVLYIILSIITCGLFSLYWICTLTSEIDDVCNNPQKRNSMLVLILSFLTCGLYLLYWVYKNGELIDAAGKTKGIKTSSEGGVFIILQIFGLGIIDLAIMQSDLNKLLK